MTSEQRPCEACGETGLVPLYVVRGYAIDRCRRCGLRRVAKPPPPEVLGSLYGEEFFRAGHKFGASSDNSRGARKNAARRLAMIRDTPGALLDVGCATGDFLVQARLLGWRVAGVEWSSYAADVARGRGLEVSNASFLDAPFPEASFDVITLWDYIEHVAEPGAHLLRANALLKPGGRLLLSTGDTASPFATMSGRRWHLLIPPKHLFYFDRVNIRLLLERNNFIVESIRWLGKHVNLSFLANKGADLFPSRLTRSAARVTNRSGLGALDLYFNLRDIMTVGAIRRS